MRKLLILSLILGSIVTLFCDDKPPWLKMRPRSSEYYLGIGMAFKSDAQYREKATSNALNNLASEIEVTISGEVISHLLETNHRVEEQLKSEVRTKTRAKLSDYELVASWQNKKEYWVYYRLNKKTYKQNRKREIDKVTSLALDMYLAARQNERNHDFVLAISNYFQALQIMEPYLSESLTVEYENQRIFLNNEAYLALQEILSRIDLEPERKSYSLKAGRTLKSDIRVKCVLRNASSSFPLKSFPLKNEFIQGEGDLFKLSSSSEQGLAKITLSRIASPQSVQIIQSEADLFSFLRADSLSYLLQNMVAKLPVSSSRIILNIKHPIIHFDTVESNLGQRESLKYLEPVLKSKLAEESFKFSDELVRADYALKIRAETRRGSEQFGMFTVFASVNLTLTDQESDSIIFETSLSKVKGIDLDEEKAGRKALENCADKLYKQILPGLQGE